MNKKIIKINNEILVSLCSDCKCCLAKGTHCYICHTQNSIKEMCGCGDCEHMAQDFEERERVRHASWISSMRTKNRLRAA